MIYQSLKREKIKHRYIMNKRLNHKSKILTTDIRMLNDKLQQNRCKHIETFVSIRYINSK